MVIDTTFAKFQRLKIEKIKIIFIFKIAKRGYFLNSYTVVPNNPPIKSERPELKTEL